MKNYKVTFGSTHGHAGFFKHFEITVSANNKKDAEKIATEYFTTCSLEDLEKMATSETDRKNASIMKRFNDFGGYKTKVELV